MKTYSEVLKAGTGILMEAGISEANIDSYLLFEYVFHMPRSQYFLKKDRLAPDKEIRQFQALIQKRAAHIPVQYITGTQEFYGLEFMVNEHVLIPRQDTETLVEESLKEIQKKIQIKTQKPENEESSDGEATLQRQVRILDLCTGSGCIAISIAKNAPKCQVVAADISEDALEVARENAMKNQVQVEFIRSDLFENIDGVYDFIISNPPYIRTDVIETLEPEVKDHEPRLALDGTGDGLLFYRKIVQEGKEHLRADGKFLFEIGYDQAEEVSEILEENGFGLTRVIKDLPGLDRVVVGEREEKEV